MTEQETTSTQEEDTQYSDADPSAPYSKSDPTSMPTSGSAAPSSKVDCSAYIRDIARKTSQFDQSETNFVKRYHYAQDLCSLVGARMSSIIDLIWSVENTKKMASIYPEIYKLEVYPEEMTDMVEDCITEGRKRAGDLDDFQS